MGPGPVRARVQVATDEATRAYKTIWNTYGTIRGTDFPTEIVLIGAHRDGWGAGAADNVSSIFRMTILQASAPDVMRGRLQGVFTVVVTGGPRLGDLYIGLLALTGALWFPPLLGGLLIVVLVATIVRVQRGVRRYDALEPTP